MVQWYCRIFRRVYSLFIQKHAHIITINYAHIYIWCMCIYTLDSVYQHNLYKLSIWLSWKTGCLQNIIYRKWSRSNRREDNQSCQGWWFTPFFCHHSPIFLDKQFKKRSTLGPYSIIDPIYPIYTNIYIIIYITHTHIYIIIYIYIIISIIYPASHAPHQPPSRLPGNIAPVAADAPAAADTARWRLPDVAAPAAATARPGIWPWLRWCRRTGQGRCGWRRDQAPGDGNNICVFWCFYNFPHV